MPKKPFERKDRFYFKAKTEGYPARSAYKIMELDDRFKIFKPRSTVIDLGCAPGGWLKVGQERLGDKGTLVGIDLLPVKFSLAPYTHFLQGDFTVAENREWIKSKLPGGRAHWIISDMSPNISGVKFRDGFQSYELVRLALHFTSEHLRTGGGFLCKIFPSSELEDLRKEIKSHFEKLVTVIPEATRASSTEVYLVALGKK